jgi:hypothetical protein
MITRAGFSSPSLNSSLVERCRPHPDDPDPGDCMDSEDVGDVERRLEAEHYGYWGHWECTDIHPDEGDCIWEYVYDRPLEEDSDEVLPAEAQD